MSKSNEFYQHVPNYMDIDRQPPIEFDTTEELLANEYVSQYLRKDDSSFVMGDDHLMVISDNGFKWQVAGVIRHPDQVNLPKWEGAKYRVKWVKDYDYGVVYGKDGVSICGNDVIIKNNGVATQVSKEEFESNK
jgi:hypothetical protein